jgi:hypothetical protein
MRLVDVHNWDGGAFTAAAAALVFVWGLGGHYASDAGVDKKKFGKGRWSNRNAMRSDTTA